MPTVSSRRARWHPARAAGRRGGNGGGEHGPARAGHDLLGEPPREDRAGSQGSWSRSSLNTAPELPRWPPCQDQTERRRPLAAGVLQVPVSHTPARRTGILLTHSTHALGHALPTDQDEVLHRPAKNERTMRLVLRCPSTRTSSGTQPRRRPSMNRKLWGKNPRLCKQARYVTDWLPWRGDDGFCCTTQDRAPRAIVMVTVAPG